MASPQASWTNREDAPDETAALHDLVAFGRERRRQAEAASRWQARRGQGAMPPVAALDRCGGPVEADRGCIVMVAPGRPGAAPPAPAPLAAAILARWPEVTGPAAPLRVEVRTAAGRMWRGLLLPYEVPGGGVGAVEAVVTEAGVPDAPDLAGVADALAGLAGADEHMMGAAQWPGAAPADELLLEPLAAPLKRSVGRVVPPLSSPWGRLAA